MCQCMATNALVLSLGGFIDVLGEGGELFQVCCAEDTLRSNMCDG